MQIDELSDQAAAEHLAYLWFRVLCMEFYTHLRKESLSSHTVEVLVCTGYQATLRILVTCRRPTEEENCSLHTYLGLPLPARRRHLQPPSLQSLPNGGLMSCIRTT